MSSHVLRRLLMQATHRVTARPVRSPDFNMHPSLVESLESLASALYPLDLTFDPFSTATAHKTTRTPCMLQPIPYRAEKVILSRKPCLRDSPWPFRVLDDDIVIVNNGGEELRHLHHRDILPQTHPGPLTELTNVTKYRMSYR